MSQTGSGTTILEQDTYQQLTYRPFAVNRLDRNVGQRPIVGISQIFDSNMRNMDSRTLFTRDDKRFFGKGNQNTARLGQSLPHLPDRRNTSTQDGAGVFQDIGKFAKKTVHDVKKGVKKGVHDVKKGVKEGAKAIGHEVSELIKNPEKELKKIGKTIKRTGAISKGLTAVAGVAGLLGQVEIAGPAMGAARLARLGGFGVGRVDQAKAEMNMNTRGARGNERQSFVPTHPRNFNKARLDKL